MPTKPVSPAPTVGEEDSGLSLEQTASLESLELLDEYPLYKMNYYGSYPISGFALPDAIQGGEEIVRQNSWACSLFAVFADPGGSLYGRNFDWQYSPALVLFTDPPDGFASVSMVDIAYLGYDGSRGRQLLDLPFTELLDLLEAPYLPFDGMNEFGVVVGMAAVPDSEQPGNPELETIDSLMVIRLILDHAKNVDEALVIFRQYKLDWGRGPALHYLVADRSRRSVLIEYWRGEVNVIENQTYWQAATNFLQSAYSSERSGVCSRYDTISEQMEAAHGRMSPEDAMQLLTAVSQPNTQWSVVYGMDEGEIRIVMGQNFDKLNIVHLKMAIDP